MKRLFILSLFLFILSEIKAQNKIIVKDQLTGKIKVLKKGKLLGIITYDDTINYGGRDPFSKFWILKSFNDSSLTIELRNTNEKKTYNFCQIKFVSFIRNENDGAPVGMVLGGAGLTIAAPLVGIHKNGYDFEQAGYAFTAGIGLLSIAYLVTRNRDLRTYTIIGTK